MMKMYRAMGLDPTPKREASRKPETELVPVRALKRGDAGAYCDAELVDPKARSAALGVPGAGRAREPEGRKTSGLAAGFRIEGGRPMLARQERQREAGRKETSRRGSPWSWSGHCRHSGRS